MGLRFFVYRIFDPRLWSKKNLLGAQRFLIMKSLVLSTQAYMYTKKYIFLVAQTLRH